MREWDRHGTYNWDTREYNYTSDEPDVYILAEDNDGGWDWQCTAVVGRKVGDDWEYAVYTDRGCSCNGPYEDNPETYDLAWTKDKVAVLKSATGDMSVTDAVDFRTEFYRSLRELLVTETAKRIANISAGLNERLAKND